MRTLTMAIIAALCALALALVVAVPAATAEDITIPVGKTQQISGNITAHLVQVSVLGAPITSDNNDVTNISDYIWPTLDYYYENTGPRSENGHLTVKFMDDKGDEYKVSDAGTLMTVDPGTRSENRYMGVHVPKDRKIVRLTIVQGFDETPIDLVYPSATAVKSATPTAQAAGNQPGGTGTPAGKLCLGSWALPLLLGGVVVLGTGLRFTRANRK